MFKCLSAFALVLSIASCGGGGGGTSTTPTQPTDPLAVDLNTFSCDPVAVAAKMPLVPLSGYIVDPGGATDHWTYERFPVTIDGKAEELNVAFGWPSAGTSIQGIAVFNHGLSTTLTNLPITSMVDDYWSYQMTKRGYVTVFIARRGAYGSTGAMIIDIVANGMHAQYQAGQITHKVITVAGIKYQSDSVVAVLDKLAQDQKYSNYLNRILMVGGSGGSVTSLQAFVDSPQFRAATNKAIQRFDSGDTTRWTNPDAFVADRSWLTDIGPVTPATMWIGGVLDPITSYGQLSCEYNYFNHASKEKNYFFWNYDWWTCRPKYNAHRYLISEAFAIHAATRFPWL